MNHIFGNVLLFLFASGMSTVTSVAVIAAEIPGKTFQRQPVTNTTNTEKLPQQTNAFQEDETSVSQFAEPAKTESLAQVTSVSQLSDVQPTDWAFQALQSLVERYGCIAGYPDRTYRGNRALTRYEFAAGLNSCLDRINELIAAATTDLVRREDLATLQRLQEEFGAELATLRGRVDALEAVTAQLEANQFSTTTKLNGEVIFALSDTFGNGLDDNGLDDNTVFQGRARLNFDTSFTGDDQLRVRLQAGNFQNFRYVNDGLTNEGQLAYATGTDNQFRIGDLFYYFPIGDKIVAHLMVVGGEYDDYLNIVDPLLTGTGTGAVSNFAYNPIINAGGQNAGLGLDFKITDKIALNLGYMGGEANDPSPGAGFFNGDNSYLARLEYVDRNFQIAFTYLHGYTGGGSTYNTNELGSVRSILTGINSPTVSNNYGVEAAFAITPGIRIGGWGGYSNATVLGIGRAEIWNYAATLDFPDFGKEGNLLAFIVGVEPRLAGTTGFLVDGRRKDPDQGLHVEGIYRYQVSDNISITPGVIWLTAPGHDSNNDDIIIGTIRTTFQF